MAGAFSLCSFYCSTRRVHCHRDAINSRPSQSAAQDLCMHINPCIYTYLYSIFLNITIFIIYIKLHKSPYWCFQVWSIAMWIILTFLVYLQLPTPTGRKPDFTRLFNEESEPGLVAHACNPSNLGLRRVDHLRLGIWDQPDQHGETPTLKYKISRVWWCMPVIPATQEAEAGELPEPRRWRLRWAEIMPLHSSLGNKSETLSQKKTKHM